MGVRVFIALIISIILIIPVTVTTVGSGKSIQLRNDTTSPIFLNETGTYVIGNVSHYIFPPSMNGSIKLSAGHISPVNYGNSPAPMGISDLGLTGNGSAVRGFNISTSAVKGNIRLDGASFPEFHSGNFSVQLNAVLHNVSIGGKEYQLWTQNVAIIDAATGTMQLVDNVWDLNHGIMDRSIIKLGNGSFPSSLVYIDIGPTFHFSFPMTLNLSMSSVIKYNSDAVEFNYTVASSSGTYNGSFDTAVFSNYARTGGKPPEYLISGTVLVNKNLAYDLEWIIGGEYDGRNADFSSINGTMHLYTSSNHSYTPVNSSMDYGVDTGETSAGIDPAWNGTTAVLAGGPSLLYGMWNMSSGQHFTRYSVTLNPPDSFAFIEREADNRTTYAWLPLGCSGHISFQLPAGNYSIQAMLSGHTGYSGALQAATMSIMLPGNASIGIDTPIYAFNNTDLSHIFSTGNGTLESQYDVSGYLSAAGEHVSRMFNAGNTFGNKVLPEEILVNGTDSYVHIAGSPFPVRLLHTLHISITRTDSSIYLADSSSDLIFNSSNGGYVDLQNSSGNFISGNRYLGDSYMFGGKILDINGSGNYIFNNIFLSMDPVVSTGIAPNGSPEINVYNVSMARFQQGVMVNGFNLSRGGYLTNITGGNLWMGYKGVGYYNDGHMNSDDYAPSAGTIFNSSIVLLPRHFYTHNAEIHYLQEIGYIQLSSRLSSRLFYHGGFVRFNQSYNLPDMNYTYQVGGILPATIYPGTHTTYGPESGQIKEGAKYTFYTLTARIHGGYPVNITEAGLAPNSTWMIKIPYTATPLMGTSGQTVLIANGTHSYTVVPPAGYYAYNGTFKISGSPATVHVTFKKLFHLEIILSPGNASLSLNGTSMLSSGKYLNLTLRQGTYELNATAYGYSSLVRNITISGNSSHVMYLNLTPFHKATMGINYGIYAAIAAIAIAGTASFLYARKRRIR